MSHNYGRVATKLTMPYIAGTDPWIADHPGILDLMHASSLTHLDLRSKSREFPLRFCNLVRAVQGIIPKPLGTEAPPPLHINIILLADPLMDTHHLRDSWLERWPQLLQRTSALHCGGLTLRARHPLSWDEHLIEGLSPLQRMYPIRLEHETVDGTIHPHIAERTPTSALQI